MGDVTDRVDALVAMVADARILPLSASCVLNRVELLAALEDVQALLPAALVESERVVAERDAILDDARRQAADIVERAYQDCRRLASDTAVAAEAEAIVAAAWDARRSMRAEIDSYVDTKLACFEALLSRTLNSVSRGRAQLAAAPGAPDEGDPAGGPPGPAGGADDSPAPPDAAGRMPGAVDGPPAGSGAHAPDPGTALRRPPK